MKFKNRCKKLLLLEQFISKYFKKFKMVAPRFEAVTKFETFYLLSLRNPLSQIRVGRQINGIIF